MHWKNSKKEESLSGGVAVIDRCRQYFILTAEFDLGGARHGEELALLSTFLSPDTPKTP
jgi:hypothetical protein